MTSTGHDDKIAEKSASTGHIFAIANSDCPRPSTSTPDEHCKLHKSSDRLDRAGDLHKWKRSSNAHDRVTKGIRVAKQTRPQHRPTVHWQTRLQRRDRMTVARPIEPKPTETPRLPTLEQRVSETFDLRRSSQKDAEKARRDRLKEAFDRLVELLPRDCANPSNVKTPQMAADFANAPSGNLHTRAGVVESTIGYITCLRSNIERLQRQLDECQCRSDG